MTVQVEHYGAREPTHRQQVKAWLSQARLLKQEIADKKELRDRMRAQVERCTQAISSAAGGGKRDWTDTSARLDVLEKAIDRDHNRLLEIQTQINDAIAQLPTPKMRMLMEKRYLKGMSWTQIAREMNFGRATVFRIHDNALDLIEIPKIETP